MDWMLVPILIICAIISHNVVQISNSLAELRADLSNLIKQTNDKSDNDV